MCKAIFLFILVVIGALTGCVQNDPSTYIVDDQGMTHHTVYRTLDFRGRVTFPKRITPSQQKVFVFDPKNFAWAAYDKDGNRLLTGGASGGADFCEDVNKPCRTVTGTFKVYAKRGADCRSGEYPVETEGGAKMPYCMYFYRGYTIHAAYAVPHYNSSHGCIRVYPSAAKWLNEEFITLGTKVIVLSYDHEDGDGDWLIDE
ncbi:MAG: enhanced entry protein EnhA [Legionellales bacterium RIFCSPHIGHO2_12_FULL_35_11]|nr:MAG: enhanced entry protein EnhA [Legionellales bacterium RIFCSPHIGHO2_12_FULL_35_11]